MSNAHEERSVDVTAAGGEMAAPDSTLEEIIRERQSDIDDR